jgi:hypothetical protein
MFDLRVPDSMKAIPGRRVVCIDDGLDEKLANIEAQIEAENARVERGRAACASYYARNREAILERQREKRRNAGCKVIREISEAEKASILADKACGDTWDVIAIRYGYGKKKIFAAVGHVPKARR